VDGDGLIWGPFDLRREGGELELETVVDEGMWRWDLFGLLDKVAVLYALCN